MSALMQDDPNVVAVTALVGPEVVEDEAPQMPSEESDNFRDILCIIISSILCCPAIPCASWISLYYHQKATELYWTGNYTESALKQSLSVKFLIGQCVVSPIILIILMFLYGPQIFGTLYPIEVQNGPE
eukprot:UN01588